MTSVVHGLIILLLVFLVAWRPPDPPIEEYGIELTRWDDIKDATAVILAVAHNHYKQLQPSDIDNIMADNSVIMDVKCTLDREAFTKGKADIWRL